MKRYIALLRGINISGKNRIAMSELKKDLVGLGYADIGTYLNSGNVVFSSAIGGNDILSGEIEAMISERYNLNIPVFIIPQEELQERLANAPDWWGDGNKEIYDNLIFIMPPLSYDDICAEIGAPRAEYEKVYNYKDVIFWSFSRKDYQRTNWWSKTANSDISGKITIRTANTVRKIAGMQPE